MVKVKADKCYQVERQIEREIAVEGKEELEGRAKKAIEFEEKMEGCQMVLLEAYKYPWMDREMYRQTLECREWENVKGGGKDEGHQRMKG